jgi:8-oxo-dGTP pyrophosphatase MutT (NUDIX family)
MKENAIRYEAAGGVVYDARDGEESHVLVLLRPARNEVRLPKGHIEEGESASEAALREVREESGYLDLEVVAELGERVVEFDHEGRHYARTERYFLMRLGSDRLGDRDRTDHQFTPRWVSWSDAETALTFEAERAWIRRAHKLLL